MAFELPARSDLYVLYSTEPATVLFQSGRLRSAGFRVFPSGPYLVAERPWTGAAASHNSLRGAHIAFAEGSQSVVGPHVPLDRLERLLEACGDPNSLSGSVEGDVTFLQVEPAEQRITAVRACGGLAPLYVWRPPGAVMIATRCSDLARIGGWDEGPDPLGLAIAVHASFVFLERRTHLRGISLIGLGEACRIVQAREPVWYQYWDPQSRARHSRPNQRERVERQTHFREVLFKQLAEHLHPEALNMLSLSGGVDSASLAAVIRAGLNYPLGNWSLVPNSTAKNLDREMSYLDRIQQRYRLSPVIRESPTLEERLDRFGRSAPSIALPPAPALGAIGTHPRLLGRHFSVVGGEGADEVVGSDPLTGSDWANATALWRCLIPGTALSLRHGLKRKFRNYRRTLSGEVLMPLPTELNPIFSKELRREFLDVRASFQRLVRMLPTENRSMWLFIKYFDFQASSWEFSSLRGIHHFFPFRTREILELSIESHPSERMGPTEKRLLRGALSRDVEPEFLHRNDKGGFGEQELPPPTIAPILSELATMPAFQQLLGDNIPRDASNMMAFHVYFLNTIGYRTQDFVRRYRKQN